MTVAALGRGMSSAEFGDWLRYAEVEPFGPLVDGAAAAWLANINRDRKKHPDAILAAEAVLAFAQDKPEPVSLVTKLRRWAASTKGSRQRVRKVPR